MPRIEQESRYISSSTKILLLALCIPLLVCAGRLFMGNGDFTHFIIAGDLIVDKNDHPYPLKLVNNSLGYDGQFFYQLALDPTTLENQAFGINSDLSYRKQRILYPLISNLVALNNPYHVPVSLVFVNLMSIWIGIYFVHKLILMHKAPMSYLFLYAGMIGFNIALTRDLAECMEGLFLTLSVYFFLNRNILLLTLFSTCALLTRETSIFIIGPLILVLFNEQRRIYKLFSMNSILICLPGALLLGWKYYLFNQFGGFTPNQFQIIPLKGILDAQVQIVFGTLHENKYNSQLHIIYGIYTTILLIWIFSVLFYAFIKSKAKGNLWAQWVWLSILFWIALSLFFNNTIYNSDLGFGRIYNGVLIMSILFLMTKKIKLPNWVLIFSFSLMSISIIRLIIMT